MSDWHGKSPGIERAQAVMRPQPQRDENWHGDYVHTSHSQESGLYSVPGTHITSMVNETFGFVTFAADDSFPDTRIISADRVEPAVETATFLDICNAEGVCALSRGTAASWLVYSPDDMNRPSGVAASLRGAYVAYHSANPTVRHRDAPQTCDNCRHVDDCPGSDPCGGCIAGAFDGWEASDE